MTSAVPSSVLQLLTKIRIAKSGAAKSGAAIPGQYMTLTALEQICSSSGHYARLSTFNTETFLVMKSVVFWVITRRRVVNIYRRFGITYRSHLHGSRFQEEKVGILTREDGTDTLSRNVGK
jgi:hypothetical protein